MVFFFPFSKSINTYPSNLCISRILLISWRQTLVSSIIKQWSAIQPPHYATFLELKINLHQITVMIQEYYVRVRAAAVQTVYSMHVKSLIQRAPDHCEQTLPCCVAQRMWLSKNPQSQITKSCIVNITLKMFSRKKQVNDTFLKIHW